MALPPGANESAATESKASMALERCKARFLTVVVNAEAEWSAKHRVSGRQFTGPSGLRNRDPAATNTGSSFAVLR
jgi:hypothetical protein